MMDRDCIRDFLTDLHAAAARACEGIADPGVLQLTKLFPHDGDLIVAGRFEIGDVDNMVDVAVANTQAGSNVYIEGRTVDRNTPAKLRGSGEGHTRAVFALVEDHDAWKDKTDPHGLQPTWRVDTSEGSWHAWHVLDRAIPYSQAKEIGAALRAISGADSDTGNAAQPYRVAGTINYPSAKKIALGRQACPTTFTNGGPVRSADELRTVLESIRPQTKQSSSSASSDEAASGYAPKSIEDLIAEVLPIEADRSKRFAHALKCAVEQGMTLADFEALCWANPQGCCGKYMPANGRNDLSARIAELWRRHSAEHAEKQKQADREIEIICASEFEGREIPRRRFLVEGVIPARNVTLLTGDGGTGKSLLALQLAAAAALNMNWIGMEVCEPGAVLYLSAEDEVDELHRRLADIVKAYGRTLADLANLRIVPLAGEDALLAVPESRSNVLSTTGLFAKVKAEVAESRPSLVILDTLADLFGGEENQRTQARQFVSLLRGVALKSDTAIVMLAHPSLTGLAAGTGSSGSTGWSNSVRSRLFLHRVLDEQKQEPDPDLRVLRTTKTNYSRTGGEVRLKWQSGVFVLADGASIGGQFDRAAADLKAEHIFMDCLKLTLAQGRKFSPHKCATYAPSCFARLPNAQGFRAPVLASAMERLLAASKIIVDTSGPPSKQRTFLAFPDACSEAAE